MLLFFKQHLTQDAPSIFFYQSGAKLDNKRKFATIAEKNQYFSVEYYCPFSREDILCCYIRQEARQYPTFTNV